MRLAVEILRRDTGERRTLSFNTSPVRIGRSPLNNLTIDAPWISQHHGLIRFGEDQADFVDLGSTNGTVLWNGVEETRVPASVPHRLFGPGSPPTAELRVGPLAFVIRPLPDDATGDAPRGPGKLDTRLTMGELRDFQAYQQSGFPPPPPSTPAPGGGFPFPSGPGGVPTSPVPGGTPGPMSGYPGGFPPPPNFPPLPGSSGFPPPPNFPQPGFPSSGFPAPGASGVQPTPGQSGLHGFPPQNNPLGPGRSGIVPTPVDAPEPSGPRYLAGHTKMAQPGEARALLEQVAAERAALQPRGAPSTPGGFTGGGPSQPYSAPSVQTSALARLAALGGAAPPRLEGQDRAFVESLAAITESFAQGLQELKRGLKDLGDQLGVRVIGGHSPLHRSQSSVELLRYLLDPSGDTRQRLEELVDLFADFMLHEVALLNGIKQGLHHMVHELDPEGGYAAQTSGGIGLFDRSLKRYREYFTRQTEDDGHDLLFGESFAQAYADAGGVAPGDRKRRE